MTKYMTKAIELATKAFKKKEIPVGAVIVKNKKIISSAFNNRHTNNNVLGHAEIIAVFKAQKKLKDWRLNGCEMYVTLKPCELCEKILKESRISKVHYLIEKLENKKSYQQTELLKFKDFNQEMANSYQRMLSQFFENKR